MVKGIGVDIVEIARIGRAIAGERFLSRVFTEAERAYIGTGELDAQRAAGNYAVKEALSKALGCGLAGCPPDRVQVLRGESGAPYVEVLGSVRALMEERGIRNVWVTISHDGGMAAAVVVLEGD